MSITVRAAGDGARLAVRVMPRSQPAGAAGERGGRLLVRLGAAPVDGRANAELLAVLARLLGVPRSRLTIVAGERARDKEVAVADLTAADLAVRVEALAAGGAGQAED